MSVKPGELVDPQPNHPGCMDAPSFQYVVEAPQGRIVIWAKEECKTMTRKNATAADTEIMQILSAIVALDKSNN